MTSNRSDNIHLSFTFSVVRTEQATMRFPYWFECIFIIKFAVRDDILTVKWYVYGKWLLVKWYACFRMYDDVLPFRLVYCICLTVFGVKAF